MNASLYYSDRHLPRMSEPSASSGLARITPEWQSIFADDARRALADLAKKGGWRGRLAAVVAVSLLLHASAWLLWQVPAVPVSAPRIMRSVEVALVAPQPVAVVPPAPQVQPQTPPEELPKPKPLVKAKPRPLLREKTARQEPIRDEPVSAPAPTPAVQAPAAPFVEANYRAAYLNNPPPKYPMAAKERHIEGLVVLKVQVLSDGSSGNVSIDQSSGHEVLDEAAAEAARRWRFVPAKRGDETVASVVLIPIEFKLKS